jgi:4-aminobutyrate aminotransferase-like enzyme
MVRFVPLLVITEAQVREGIDIVRRSFAAFA